MQRIVGTLTLAVMTVVAVGIANAQPPGGRGPGGFGRGPGGGGFGGGGPGGVDIVTLLSLEQVQNEIELIDEQKADLAKLREEAEARRREQFQGGGDFRNLSEEERRQRFDQIRQRGEESRRELQSRVEQILLPHQLDRVEQIQLQIRGTAALGDDDIAEQLNLSQDQRDQIARIREEGMTRAQELFRGGRGDDGNRDAIRQQFEQFRREQGEKVLGVLTSQQRAKFEEMQGEKLEIDLSALQRRGGPGGGAPGGRDRFRRPGGEGGGRPQRPAGERAPNET